MSDSADGSNSFDSPRAPSFSLLAIFYWATLIALGMGTFGPAIGIGLSIVVAAVHSYRAFGRVGFWIGVGLALPILGLLVALLLPAVQVTREATRRNSSRNYLMQIAVALHSYNDTHGQLPSAVTRGDGGEPLHSWRTTILPQLGFEVLYDEVDHDSAWNSAANNSLSNGAALKDTDYVPFHSPRWPANEDPSYESNYFAVVGDETAWPLDGKVSLTDEDFSDGRENTVLLIEAARRGVRWCEPRDLTIDEAMDLLMGQGERTWVDEGFFLSARYRGDGITFRCLAFADGRVRCFFPFDDRKTAHALLTRIGGESIDLDAIQKANVRSLGAPVETIINWGNIALTSLYVGLAALPLFKAPRERLYGVGRDEQSVGAA